MNTFRTVVYFVNQEHVSRVKVTKRGWEDPNIREAVLALTSMIRLFMFFRAAVCFWAATELAEGRSKKTLAGIVLGFDLYLMLTICQKAMGEARVMAHQNLWIPGLIQATLCVAGCVAFLFDLFA